LPFSRFFARVHPTLGVPLNALILTVVLVCIFGCIFLGSTAALNAILSASVVALGVSYGIPVAILLCRGRSVLPKGSFNLGKFGYFCNIVGVAFVLITTVFFCFPPAIPTSGSSMNYTVVAFAIVLIVATIQWWVDGRKNFKGPRVELEETPESMLEGRLPQNVNLNLAHDAPAEDSKLE